MSWEQHALFYHIYPLGLCGAPWENPGGEPVSRINQIYDWIPHLKKLHVNAVYFSPLWESGTHGYDTHDYTQLDRRLGTNDDFAALCNTLHGNGIRVVIDGVFNHVGRGFFAFQDVLKNGQSSPYCSWFCNLWFGGSNRFGDPFSYESWHGCEELVKLNLRNEDVVRYLEDAIIGWMDRFHIDGIRFDAADCIDMDFFRRIRHTIKSRNPECWLMGELIHGDYARWANPEMLDSSTNYECWKGIWSSHNDKNYFEINYAINRQSGSQGGIYRNLLLYNFADNHDVARLASQLHDQRHLPLVYALLYAMPGIPSIYYGSEFAITGEKQHGDQGLRPALKWADMHPESNALCQFLYNLGAAYTAHPVLHTGSFFTVEVRNQQLVFRRGDGDDAVYCLLNLADGGSELPLPVQGDGWVDLLTGKPVQAGRVQIPAFTAMWIGKPNDADRRRFSGAENDAAAAPVQTAAEPVSDGVIAEMSTAELIAKLAQLRAGMPIGAAAEIFGKAPRPEGDGGAYTCGAVTLRLTGQSLTAAVLEAGETSVRILLG